MKEFEQKVKDGEEEAASLGPELVEKVLECAKFKKARKQRLLNISTKQERNLFRDRSSNIGGVDEERCDPCRRNFAGKQRYRQGGWDCAHGCQGAHFKRC